MRTFLVGADPRVPPDEADPYWKEARRQAYLLRPEVPRPLSVDRNVWRSLPMADGSPAPDPLPWVSYGTVYERTLGQGGGATFVIVVIGFVAADADDEALARTNSFEAELVVEPGWTFLGFDVADGITSGLSNCGYGKEEVDSLRATWGPRLNELGLFDSPDDAVRFRDLTNARVPEHAPFSVYGLWIVENP